MLLDFGQELAGGIELGVQAVCDTGEAKVRIRFGESASEAMSELGGKSHATNDHACRDMVVTVRDLSMNVLGETGFRFVRIDLLTPDVTLAIRYVKAVFIYRDLPYLGSFCSSDPLLNRIWEVGAYTVHLNMQKYVWDGIKRDRLVWIGDLHPEIATIQAVFGNAEIIRKSLDFVVSETPDGAWMNDIPTYSMWWIIIQHDYFMQFGDKDYLEKQLPYLRELMRRLSLHIDQTGRDTTPEMRFIDWATKETPEAVEVGLQAMHVWATRCAKEIFSLFGEETFVRLCEEDLQRLCAFPLSECKAKQANALAVIAGLLDAENTNEQNLKIGGSAGLSTFMGFYILRARAMAGDYEGALATVREYWGGMLSLGATSFWEDFDIKWMENAAPIDRLPKEYEVDVHASYGRHCYRGFRHSLCHGWASGPTAWLTEYVLGVKPAEPGCRKLYVEPHLCDLKWVKGSYPTPNGVVEIEHRLQDDGKVRTEVHAPEGIEVIIKG